MYIKFVPAAEGDEGARNFEAAATRFGHDKTSTSDQRFKATDEKIISKSSPQNVTGWSPCLHIYRFVCGNRWISSCPARTWRLVCYGV